jgi:hypothetical protein
MDYGITIVLSMALILMTFWLASPYILKKKKWYRIERADGTLFVLYRTKKELWRNDILRFKDENGHEYTFHWHWITTLEEISDAEVNVVKQEIENLKSIEDSK